MALVRSNDWCGYFGDIACDAACHRSCYRLISTGVRLSGKVPMSVGAIPILF